MKTYTLFTGNELLIGQILNVNLKTLGQEWNDRGWELVASKTVRDGLDSIADGLNLALERADCVVICGGLGATSDDLTRKAVGLALGLEVRSCAKFRAVLEERMNQRGRPQSDCWYEIQSERIGGAELLENSTGLAPGQYIEHQGKIVVLLPGPPVEFNPMLRDELIPRLAKMMSCEFEQLTYLLMGAKESEVERTCAPLVKQFPEVGFAFCASYGYVRLSLQVGNSEDKAKLDKQCQDLFGDDLIKGDSIELELFRLIKDSAWTFASAESCTGGLISARMTDVPGASEVVQGGIVTYANEWKQSYLGVSEEIITGEGVVSAACAKAMCKGLRDRFEVNCGVSVTGIAGPGGATKDKPVGLVYIGSFTPEGLVISENHFRGDRQQVRSATVIKALDQLRRQIIS